MCIGRQSGSNRRILTGVATLVALLVPVVSSSVETEPARFLIDSISVRGLERASTDVIVGESLIVGGRTYTEIELRQAAYRVKRLPFVLDVDVSLEKGTVRGRYVLVLTVEETERWFFHLNLAADRYGGDLLEDDETNAFLQAGSRLFVGRNGVAYAAVGNDGFSDADDGFFLEVGHTQYNLIRGSGFLAMSARLGDGGDSVGGSLHLGLPVGGNHSLQAEARYSQTTWEYWIASEATGDGTLRRSDDESISVACSWLFDNRDDPLFPTQGMMMKAGVTWQKDDRPATRFVALSSELTDGYDDEELWLVVEGKRHVQISRGSAISFGLGAGIGRRDSAQFVWTNGANWQWQYVPLEEDLTALLASAGFLKTVWRPRGSPAFNDLRWETHLRVGHVWSETQATIPDAWRAPQFDDDGIHWSLSTALVLRNRWGLFRLGLLYRDDDRGILARLQ
jgi:hypothetical protein